MCSGIGRTSPLIIGYCCWSCGGHSCEVTADILPVFSVLSRCSILMLDCNYHTAVSVWHIQAFPTTFLLLSSQVDVIFPETAWTYMLHLFNRCVTNKGVIVRSYQLWTVDIYNVPIPLLIIQASPKTFHLKFPYVLSKPGPHFCCIEH